MKEFIIVATIVFQGFPPAKVTPVNQPRLSSMAECQRVLANLGDIPAQMVDVRCEERRTR